jgi:hypothetical protein
MRDEFSEPIKRRIAARAGHLCSRPECGAARCGPQVDEEGILNVGVAAHIHAASEGGPRFLAEMTPNDRSSAENGVWLCQNCAKLIDNDVRRFSAEVLRGWKANAEASAQASIGKTRSRRRSTTTREQRSVETSRCAEARANHAPPDR